MFWDLVVWHEPKIVSKAMRTVSTLPKDAPLPQCCRAMIVSESVKLVLCEWQEDKENPAHGQRTDVSLPAFWVFLVIHLTHHVNSSIPQTAMGNKPSILSGWLLCLAGFIAKLSNCFARTLAVRQRQRGSNTSRFMCWGLQDVVSSSRQAHQVAR